MESGTPNRHDRWIAQAFRLAQFGPEAGNARVCALLVLNNSFMASGFNSTVTDPMQARFAKHPEAIYRHAEISCLKHALNQVMLPSGAIAQCTLYIARAKYTDETKVEFTQGLARPCEGCMRAINFWKVKQTIYTLDNAGWDVV